MSCFLSRCSRKLLHKGIRNQRQVRTILSAAYGCQEAWEARKNGKSLSGLDTYEFLADVQNTFMGNRKGSAIDVDIVANSLTEVGQLVEVKDLIYKLRHSSKANEFLDSTAHAFARHCLDLDSLPLLMEVMDDSVNYGVFPDEYACNLLMNAFIEQREFKKAGKIAFYLMKQEMFGNELSCWLAVYSCVRAVEEGDSLEQWAADAAEEQNAEEEEVEELVFRYPFLKNPHCDGHFDLEQPRELLGKTLAWTAPHLPQRPAILNARLLGAILSRTHPDIHNFAEDIIKKGHLFSNTIDFFQLLQSTEQQTTTEDELKAVAKKLESVQEAGQQTTTEDELKAVAKKLESVQEAGQTLSEGLRQEIESRRRDLEMNDKDQMQQLFDEWNAIREQKLTNQVQYFLKTKRLKEIEEEKKELVEREEVLHFFENQHLWERRIRQELLDAEAEAGEGKAALPSDEEYAKGIPEPRQRLSPEKRSDLLTRR